MFEINPVDLRTNPLKKEGMMAEPPATTSTRGRIRRTQEEWNSAETLKGTFLHILDPVLVIKYYNRISFLVK